MSKDNMVLFLKHGVQQVININNNNNNNNLIYIAPACRMTSEALTLTSLYASMQHYVSRGIMFLPVMGN